MKANLIFIDGTICDDKQYGAVQRGCSFFYSSLNNYLIDNTMQENINNPFKPNTRDTFANIHINECLRT